MNPTQPRITTVKRLFALSRNQCAFAGCSAALIESGGVVTGEICHIKAKSKDGPRFDPDQKDEERHSFENLILMCSPHHTVVDSRPAEFTVPVLHRLKAEHELGGPGAEATDEIARILLRNSGFIGEITQTASNSGINVAAAGSVVLVTSGLTYGEARDIALDVYRQNALELRGVAERVALERAEKLTTAFITRLRTISPEVPEALSDPDMHHVMFEAQRHSARAGSENMDAILIELLVDRTKSPQRDLLQIVLGEAVETVGRLTAEQIDALTLVFVIKSGRSLLLRTIKDLRKYLATHTEPFLGTAASTLASFQHLEYAGCGSSGIGSSTLGDLLARSYGHCFVSSLERVEFETAVQLSADKTEQLALAGCFSVGEDDTLRLAPLLEKETEKLFADVGLNSEVHERFRQLISSKARNVNTCERLKESYPRLAELEDWWKDWPAHFQLTSVGIVIAHANLRRRGIEGFDIRVWIN